MARLKWRYVAVAVLAVGGLTPPGTGLRAEPPTSVGTAATGSTPTRASAPDIPFAFEPNHGQFDPEVRFVSRGRGYTLFLTDTEAVISTKGSSPIRLALQNARTRPAVGVEPQAGTVNYLIGNDPEKWRTGIVTYERVTYDSVYPGIDLVYYGRDGLHEYDLVVGPGADPSCIAMRIDGADRVELERSTGNLQLIATNGAVFTMRSPDVYQIVNGQRETIAARYVLDGQNSVSFDVGTYDDAAPLVIDPKLVYGTFLGGTGSAIDQVSGLALDRDGAPVIVGSSETSDFPVRGPLQPRFGGLSDAVVTKLSPDGLQRVYATYIGGSSYDYGVDIALRIDGTAYIVGSTSSDDFPVRSTAFQSKRAGGADVFLLALAPNGASITESTLLGGSDGDGPTGVKLAAFRNPPKGATVPRVGVGDWIFVYGSTSSPEFPAIGAAQTHRIGERDAFVTVFDRRTLRPFYSTYVGLAGDNRAAGLTVNRRTGNLYLFLQRTDDDGPVFAQLTPFIANRTTRSGPFASLSDVQWKIAQVKKAIDSLESLASRLDPRAWTKASTLGGGLSSIGCDEEGFWENFFPPDLPDFPEEEPMPVPNYPITDDPDLGGPIPEPPPLPDDPFPFDDLSDNTLCILDSGGEQLGYRVQRRTPGSQATGVGAMVTADQLAKTVTMVVTPGCFPVPPSATCNERAVLVFYDKNLNVIAHVNFGGQRVGREFIPTAAALDAWGRLHFIGATSDNNLPVVSPVQASNHGSAEGFIVSVNPATGGSGFFSYLGGGSFDTLVDIAVDRRGNMWIVGTTQSADFPVTRSGVQPDIAGRIDGFIVKIVP